MSTDMANLVADILERGYRDYIGNGLTIEIAEYGRVEGERIKDAYGWNPYLTIRLRQVPATTPIDDRDTMQAPVGEPGSKERIDALASQYESLIGYHNVAADDDSQLEEIPASPFTLTNEQIAAALAHLLAEHETKEPSISGAPTYSSKIKRRRKRLSE